MRDAICLASGGLDSTVCLQLMKNQGLEPLPLFINYGQLNYTKEFSALSRNCERIKVRKPIELDFRDFGAKLSTGLTDPSKHIVDDAFTPCRNLMFIVSAAAFGYKLGISKIVMGLLSESTAIFPDQSDQFIRVATEAISMSLGLQFEIVLPLRGLLKAEVVELGKQIGVTDFYSCHAGTDVPCGKCIACNEYGG